MLTYALLAHALGKQNISLLGKCKFGLKIINVISRSTCMSIKMHAA